MQNLARAFVAMGIVGCGGDPPEDLGSITYVTQPVATLVGQRMPAFSVKSTASDRVLIALRPTSATIPHLEDDVLGTLERPGEGGTATFDDLVINRSGTYVFVASKPDGTLLEESARFEITVQDPATVDCVKGAPNSLATRQNDRQGVQLIDGCVITRGGGDAVNRAFGDVSCSGDTAAGSSVVVAWTGADVPASSATLIVPAPVTFAAFPSTHARAEALSLPFSGGTAGNQVLVSFAFVQTTGPMSVTCEAEATAGQVVIPARVFGQFSPIVVTPTVLSYSSSRRTLGDFDACARVDGDVFGGGTSLDLQ